MNNITDEGRIVIVYNLYTSLGLAEKPFFSNMWYFEREKKTFAKDSYSIKIKERSASRKKEQKGINVLKFVDKIPV